MQSFRLKRLIQLPNLVKTEKLCEIVADTKAAIDPELYVSSHHTCDCNPCGNDIKNVKLDIEDLHFAETN